MRRPLLGLLGLLALALPASAATQPSADLLSRVQTGLLFVRADCKGHTYTGTGFLVGPRLLLTARHVLQAEPHCVVTVRQQGSGAEAQATDWTTWFTRTRSDMTRTDLSVVRLKQPLHGYAFPLASSAPQAGDEVVALGYSSAEGLGIAQGQVADVARKGNVPELDVQLSSAHGGNGGPILNEDGQVVGLVQRGGARQIESLDLAAFLGKGHRGLCQGVARATPTTLCGTAPVGGGASSSRVYSGESFTLRYPPGWNVVAGDAVTTVFDPASPRVRLSVGHGAVSGSHPVSQRHVTFAGHSAVRREFGGALKRVSISFSGWSVTFQAPASQWLTAAPQLQAAAASFRLTP